MDIRETDLYEPIRAYLEENGYVVHAEVAGCDVTAVKDGDLIVVELKRSLSLKLLAQAADRQRAADSVYVAVPYPAGGTRAKGWRKTIHLLKRLELGLILVSFIGCTPKIDIPFHPLPLDRRKLSGRRRAIIREIGGRSGSYNTGGSVRGSAVTAYRERCIYVACALERTETASPAELRKLGTGKDTQSILYQNHYGWFARVGKGLYELSTAGRSALEEYGGLASIYRGKLASEG